MSVKWIKIETNIFDNKKIKLIDTLPEADAIFRIWINLLVLAAGTNNNGLIYLSERIPYTDEMLSTIFNKPLNIVRLALQTFINFEMITILDNNVILINNWCEKQNIEGLEKIKELNTLRAKKYRERLNAVGGKSYLRFYDEILLRDKICVYCGSETNLVLDHLIPLIQGGDNEKDNLVLCCKKCNHGKSGRLLEETEYIIIPEHIKIMYEKTKKRLNINKELELELELELDIEKKRDESVMNEIYFLYPARDINNNNRCTSKSNNDKKKIASLLKQHTKEDLINRITFYLKECETKKTYLKNFSVFLNNLPEIVEEKKEQISKVDLSNMPDTAGKALWEL